MEAINLSKITTLPTRNGTLLIEGGISNVSLESIDAAVGDISWFINQANNNHMPKTTQLLLVFAAQKKWFVDNWTDIEQIINDLPEEQRNDTLVRVCDCNASAAHFNPFTREFIHSQASPEEVHKYIEVVYRAARSIGEMRDTLPTPRVISALATFSWIEYAILSEPENRHLIFLYPTIEKLYITRKTLKALLESLEACLDKAQGTEHPYLGENLLQCATNITRLSQIEDISQLRISQKKLMRIITRTVRTAVSKIPISRLLEIKDSPEYESLADLGVSIAKEAAIVQMAKPWRDLRDEHLRRTNTLPLVTYAPDFVSRLLNVLNRPLTLEVLTELDQETKAIASRLGIAIIPENLFEGSEAISAIGERTEFAKA